ncbi:MAG TPA: EscU/YscU/HrcU family type III secretion system export apparatus switch protein [Symbiobacteriaceae bacterium]|nr:EscU/YscU/HrcU family type III secretion system export apparatus switch protein [Symbiobacteriaceae bacterium]
MPDKKEKPRPHRKAAVALGYNAGKDEAPKVLAAGRGELADKLVAIAKAHDVPIHQDHPLANALVKLEIGAAIPPELYAAVAEVLAFLWQLEREKAAGGGTRP